MILTLVERSVRYMSISPSLRTVKCPLWCTIRHLTRTAFAAYDIRYPDYEFECTLLKSRKVWPEGHHNLDIIAGYCGYDLRNHHHALADAEACAVIAQQIL